MNYIVIDQGTSSTKAFLFNSKGEIIHQNRIKHTLNNPKKFHFEFDANTIVSTIKILFKEMVLSTKDTPIKYAGMSVQRSTFLFWDKKTIKPVTHAISWQDSRAHNTIKELIEYKYKLWDITGTPLSPHFGGPKFLHLSQNNSHLKKLLKNNKIYFGPLSSFLIHSMTGNIALDNTIASRTLLFNIAKNKWSKFALKLFRVPESCLPPIVPVEHNYGNLFNSNICLKTVIGDQQAALIGQNNLKENSFGANFGTSGSIQYNIGNKPKIIKGLISSVLFSNHKKNIFMLEGTINSCNGLFYYLEKKLNINHNIMNWDERVKDINTNGIFIPGFAGISSPYWKTGFDDILIDLGQDKNQIIRAAMESIGFLTNDIICFFEKNNIALPQTLTVSGGGARQSLLQFISNISGKKLLLTKSKDKTAIGVLKILLTSVNQIVDPNINDRISFIPKGSNKSKVRKWRKAIRNYL